MFDFYSAYLNGILDDREMIYMEQPPHHEVADHTCYVLKLQKSLYGLKQAGRKWYNTLCGLLTGIGFQRSLADPAIFFAYIGGNVVILFIHVDNTTITGSSTSLNKEFKKWIGEHFEITDLESTLWLLGLAIERDRTMQTLSISQKSYIKTILRHFGLEDAKPLSILMDPNTSLSKANCPSTDNEKSAIKMVPYWEVIGALTWIAVDLWPDIVFVVGQLVQFLKNPRQVHWEAAKRVLRYLKGMKEKKLVYGASGRSGLMSFTNADGASKITDEQFPDSLSWLMVVWCPGAQRNRNWWLCQQWKLSMRQPLMLQRSWCNFNNCWAKIFGHLMFLSNSYWITNQPLP